MPIVFCCYQLLCTAQKLVQGYKGLLETTELDTIFSDSVSIDLSADEHMTPATQSKNNSYNKTYSSKLTNCRLIEVAVHKGETNRRELIGEKLSNKLWELLKRHPPFLSSHYKALSIT